MKSIELSRFGFDSHFANQRISSKAGEHYGRVIARMGDSYSLVTEKGIINSKVMGKFAYSANEKKEYPVVGDFVAIRNHDQSDTCEIVKVLKRKNWFSRKMPISGGRRMREGIIYGGTTEEQILASNIDYLFVLSGLDDNFNISRLERYLLMAKRSNLETVIVLTKLDLCSNYAKYKDKVSEITKDTDIVAISSITGEGLGLLDRYVQSKKTIVLLGSSGVGKSTLLNAVFDEEIQTTNEISGHSGKGKHTTTNRQMFFHRSGCMIIDTPGIKELQLWADEEDLTYIYSDIIDLANSCKFSNCTHKNEKGCAVNEAIENGDLSQERYRRYLKMKKEVKGLEQRKRERSSKRDKRR